MIWWVIGVYVFIFILFMPFRVKAKLSYDLPGNEGKISIILAKLKVYKEDFSLKYNAIVIKAKSGDKKTNFSEFGKTGIGDIFAINLIKSVKVNTIKSDITFGLKTRADITAIVCGVILLIENIMISYLSNVRDITVLRNIVMPSYDDSRLCTRFSFSVTVNLFILIGCFFNALFKIEKGVNIYGRQSSKKSN